MNKKKLFLSLIVLFSSFQILFSQSYKDGKCYKIVYDFYEKMMDTVAIKTPLPNFEEYNDKLKEVVNKYKPTAEEIDHCLALAMFFDESNEWVQLFHSMGGDLKKNLILTLKFYDRKALKNFDYAMKNIESVADESSNIVYYLPHYNTYDVKIWKRLLDKGLDLNAKNDDGISVLAESAGMLVGSNLDFIKFLIDNGYDYNAKTKSGKSLITAARYTDKKEIKDYLESFNKIELWNGFYDTMTFEEVREKADKLFNTAGRDVSRLFNTDYDWGFNGPCKNGDDSRRFATPDKVLAYYPGAKEYYQKSLGNGRGAVEFYFYKNKLSGVKIVWDIEFDVILKGAIEKYGNEYKREDTSIGEWHSPKPVRVAHWYRLDGKEIIVSELYGNFFAAFSTKAAIKYHEEKAKERAELERKEKLEKEQKNSKLVF